MQSDFKKYLEEKKDIQQIILQYFELDESKIDEETILKQLNKIKQVIEKYNTFIFVLKMVLNISNNHHRYNNFYNLIDQFLSFFEDQIKYRFSNKEKFEIFKSNKRIILFLMQKNILIFDEAIFKTFFQQYEINILNYYNNRLKYENIIMFNNVMFFYPEIKQYLNKKTCEIIEQKMNILQIDLLYIKEKRQIGENDIYICEIIRNDSIIEFISYINLKNISLKSMIEPSIFETNLFLKNRAVSLIEYAVFFGSIQIVRYLFYNGIEISFDLWFFAIHSNNPEIIHFIEENCDAVPNEDKYNEIFEESVKCYHIDIMNYINDKYNINKSMDFEEFICFVSLKHFNFYYFPDFFSQNISNNLYAFNFQKIIKIKNKIDLSIYFQDISTRSNNKNTANLLHQYQIYYNTGYNSTKIKIPYGFKSISDYSFYKNTRLLEISIPSSTNAIGDYAFYGCSSLKKLTIPSSIKNVGKCAFNECQSIVIQSGMQKILNNMFNGCSLLTEISIPSSIISIGDYSFENCYSITKIIIPASVLSIGKYAFHNCKKLNKLFISNSITSIGIGAFNGCILIKHIFLPASLQQGYESFNKFESIKLAFGFNKIPNFAFKNFILLKEILIPSSLKSIGKYAFDGCYLLKKIKIPNSVISIGDHAFHGCSSLKKITILSSEIKIGNYAFDSCTSVQLRNDMEKIPDNMFYGCSLLTDIKIPHTIKSIGNKTFYKCISLLKISIPPSITTIGNYSFYCCYSLKNIDIPLSVVSIGKYAFFGCTSLEKLNIPSSVKSIGENAFNFQITNSLNLMKHKYNINRKKINEINQLFYLSKIILVLLITSFFIWYSI